MATQIETTQQERNSERLTMPKFLGKVFDPTKSEEVRNLLKQAKETARAEGITSGKSIGFNDGQKSATNDMVREMDALKAEHSDLLNRMDQKHSEQLKQLKQSHVEQMKLAEQVGGSNGYNRALTDIRSALDQLVPVEPAKIPLPLADILPNLEEDVP